MAYVYDQEIGEWHGVDPDEPIVGGRVMGHKAVIWTKYTIYIYDQQEKQWRDWNLGPIKDVDLSEEKVLAWNDDVAWVYDQEIGEWHGVGPDKRIISGRVKGHKVVIWTESGIYIYDQREKQWLDP